MNKDEAEKIAAIIAKAKQVNYDVTQQKIRMASVEMVVHRAATNTDENLGLTSYFHRNPLKHYPINFMIWLRGIKRLWQQFLRTKAKK